MNISPSDENGAQQAWRRCALLLHALGTDERVWLLAQLPQDQRAPLQGLLMELQALGIPADRAFARAALAWQAAKRLEGVAAASSQMHLRDAHSDDLAGVLASEPAGLVAEALRGFDPAKREAVLVRLGATQRHHVDEWVRHHGARRAPGDAARMREALLEELGARLVPLNAVRRRAVSHAFKRRWHAVRLRFTGAVA